MAMSIARAAQESGIAITLLPSLYAYANFGEAPRTSAQRRFATTPDAILGMLGELHELSGDEPRAVELWSQALEIPSVAKSAAERLVPILDRQGRKDEVKYLAKKYLKGCC